MKNPIDISIPATNMSELTLVSCMCMLTTCLHAKITLPV